MNRFNGNNIPDSSLTLIIDFGQPEGLKESSRGSSAAARYPRDLGSMIWTLKGSENSSGTLSGCEFYADVSGGLRFAATPGYSLATLRVANLMSQVS